MKSTSISIKVTIKDAVHELERELAVREEVYPRWVRNHRISKKQARERLARLKYAIQLLTEQMKREVGEQQNLFEQ